MNKSLQLWTILFTSMALAACEPTSSSENIDNGSNVDSNTEGSEVTDSSELFGLRHTPMVFVMSNDSEKNSVLAFRVYWGGSLAFVGSYPTGGFGSGGGLGSQGALVTSEDGQFLFLVNASSNEVSAMEVKFGELILRDIVPSGGVRPISLAVHGDLLYVLNQGSDSEPGNIAGFRIEEGRLTSIASSTRALSAPTPVGPAQVAFSSNGDVLVVTERATNTLTSYLVARDGTPGAPITTPSNGQTPFGFAFNRDGSLFVSEAFGGAENGSAVSSYTLGSGGSLNLAVGSVPTEQTAACWVVVSQDGRFAYTTNTGSDSISGYHIGLNGALERFDDGGITATTGDGPIDIAGSSDGRYLYTLNGADDSISILRVFYDGRLLPVGSVTGLPASSVGIAAR